VKMLRRSCASFLILAALVASAPADAARRSNAWASPNDDFANAITLRSNSLLKPFTLFRASRDYGEPKIKSSSIGRTLWYAYRATVTGRGVVALATNPGTNAPFQVAVYTGSSVTTLTRVGAAEVTRVAGRATASVPFDTVKGTTYWIQLDAGRQLTDTDLQGWVGVQQFGASGGVAIFGSEPWMVRDYSEDTLGFFVANAHREQVRVKHALRTIGPYFRTTVSRTVLNPGDTAWYSVSDNPDATDTHLRAVAGEFRIEATSTASGVRVGTNRTKVHLLPNTWTNAPEFVVRFADPELASVPFGKIASYVTVENASPTDPAAACRFVDGDEWQTAWNWQPVALDTDTVVGGPNIPFNLEAGEKRRFLVEMWGRPGWPYESAVGLDCGNIIGSYRDTARTTFHSIADFGQLAQVKLRSADLDENYSVEVPPFRKKSIVFSVLNTGAYGGYFSTLFEDDSSLANIVSLCVSDSSGNCTGRSVDGPVNYTLAPGEQTYLRVLMTRGSSEGTGFAYLQTRALDGLHDEQPLGWTPIEVVSP